MVRNMRSSSSALPGPVSQAISVSAAVDIGDVGDAADIDHDDRPLALQRLRQRAVIDRHERRALPAGGDVGGAEIMHHGNVDRLRQRRGVADLHRQLLLGPVQHGLAVEADDVDILGRDAVLGDEGGDRFRMRDRHGLLGLAQDARPRVALRQMDGFGQGLAQQAASRARYRAGSRTGRTPSPACRRFRSWRRRPRRARCRSSDRVSSTSWRSGPWRRPAPDVRIPF